MPETVIPMPDETGEFSHFLFAEAGLLDDNRLAEWLDMITPDIEYEVPIRIVRERGGGSGFSPDSFYMKEDFGTLSTRVKRFDSEFAWSESPPTRTRRMVGNIRVGNRVSTNGSQEISVRNNIAIFCYRGDSPTPVTLTGDRQDTLRRTDEGWRLARRVVLLDSTVMGLQSLSIFL